MEKDFLFVIDGAPYGDWRGREVLDMAFAMTAFDHTTALLFTGAGVNWLRVNQEPGVIGQKSVLRNLSAAGLFGITAIYADTQSLRRFGMQTMPEALDVTETDSQTLLYTQFDHVVQL